jgi:nucleotide-binding universal stress UspA family protein
LSPVAVLLVKNPHVEILRMGYAVSAGLEGTLHGVLAYARMPVSSEAMTPSMSRKIEQQTKRAAKASLTRTLRAIGIAVSRRYLIASDPVDAIAEAAQASHSAKVVIGAPLRPESIRLLIGNSAEGILDELGCDILIVKPPKISHRMTGTARAVIEPAPAPFPAHAPIAAITFTGCACAP